MRKWKLTAVVCAAALTLSMAVTAFANPSIEHVTMETTVAQISPESTYTTVEIPEGENVVVKPATSEEYADDEEISQAIEMLLDTENVYTTVEILEALGFSIVDENGEKKDIRTTKDNPVDPEKLDIVTYMSNFAFESDGRLLPNGRIEATVPETESLKGEKLERVIIVQVDPEDHTIYFIELESLEEDGTFTAQFPCTGPFFITVRTDLAETEE
ncbi:MAG: hypothetical protein Q4E89_00845 [Eubacteriales bacterium]|nr:hypothetical protein [Eubacteriales bacterium]